MNCPNCGHELPESAERCPACSAELVGADSGEDPEHLPDALVTVLETRDATLVPVVRSLLEAEGIPVVVENEGLQDLIAAGRILTGDNPIVGPVILQVAAEDAEAARALVAHDMPNVQGEAVS